MPASTGNVPDVPDESRLGMILGVQTTVTVLAVVAVCLRLYVRVKLVRGSGIDDWTMLIAAVCPLFHCLAAGHSMDMTRVAGELLTMYNS